MQPDRERALVLERLARTRGGILLFHDTKAQTAHMLPRCCATSKRQGYRIVHVTRAGFLALSTPVNPPEAR